MQHMANLLRTWDDFTEDEVHQKLIETSIVPQTADLACKFTQIAWGRVFLDGLGITFAPTYVCLDHQGRQIETGLLKENPYYRAAMAVAATEQQYPSFLRLALMSADVRIVNQMLNEGSRASDLVTGPPHLILIGNAGEAEGSKRKRPWWRPW